MLTHVTLGSNDIDRSRAFYDAALEPLGLKRLMDGEVYSIWGADRPSVVVRTPLNGEPATFANGGTVGFAAPTDAAVAAFYAAALASGGTCEGPPGPREAAGGLVGAYVRDPDGNKMCAYSYVTG
ncbi:VOC family protein [Sphingomonas sp. BIUV-7]|uniref:VOC family protein n=1 Tax=Sphingomonas natans TaxID=3063330 RepID=A0ABT8Y862_9SPHN|nr:VOC family protein [Sphingomonas sp. BIUV-7]MDO6414500.1 VOC family protein [Sphingomonas sp. BIUV-7]